MSEPTKKQSEPTRGSKLETHFSSEFSLTQHHQESLNVSILESAAAIIGVKDDPLALVLSSAIERINGFLAPKLGENSIQKAAEARIDKSPEATAERIVSLSTVFYGEFKGYHSTKDEEQVLVNFVENLTSGIARGFEEGRDILEGLEVLEGDIESNINKTFELVKQKLAAFEMMIRDMNGLTSPES